MPQFTDRQSVSDWLGTHHRQRIRLGCAGSTLRVEGVTAGITELDACSTEVYYGELRTDLPAVQVSLTLHDEGLSVHVIVGGAEADGTALSLPVSVPYARLRLERADAHPAQSAASLAPEEPEIWPYELLHFPRSD